MHDVVEMIYEKCKKRDVLKALPELCALAALLMSFSEGTIRTRADMARRYVDELLASFNGAEKTSLKMTMLKYVGLWMRDLRRRWGEYVVAEAAYAELLSRLIQLLRRA